MPRCARLDAPAVLHHVTSRGEGKGLHRVEGTGYRRTSYLVSQDVPLRNLHYKSVDIVLVHPLDFEKAFANKTVKSAKGIEIYVASIDDIIHMKEWSGRKQDLSDAALLRRAKELAAGSDD